MKTLIFLSLFSASVFAQTSALEMMGITSVTSTPGQKVLQFRDEGKFVLSEEIFRGQKEASDYCRQHNLRMAEPGEVWLLLVTTATEPSLTESLYKKFDTPFKDNAHGFLVWLPEPSFNRRENKITDVYGMLSGDGSGHFNFDSLKDEKNKMTGLPVVCTDLKKEERDIAEAVDNSDRGIVPDKNVKPNAGNAKSATGSIQ